MMGNCGGSRETDTPGLYILCAYDIFSYLEQERYCKLEIWVSFYEIYCGKLFDLLNDKNLLQPREDGKQVCLYLL
jgi:kinesin family protein 2/24